MSNFLRAHEDMGKILFNQMIRESTPVLNTINRYSGKEIFECKHMYTCQYEIVWNVKIIQY